MADGSTNAFVRRACCLALIIAAWVAHLGCALSPSVKGMTNMRRVLREGEDMLLTCVVRNLGAHPVAWSKILNGKRDILAIDRLRVVSDDRVAVLHDKTPNKLNDSIALANGGEVWVLSIKNVTMDDAGGYDCRVMSTPPVQTFYMVAISPANDSNTTEQLRSAHNYTNCCKSDGVSEKCLGFCNIHNILAGETGVQPEKCEQDFPKIVRCMADNRDHRPCCERQGIPDICQDLCRGEYTVQNDFVKSHFSCTAFTEATLVCISEGIELLPLPPRAPSVAVAGATSVRVEWDLPSEQSPPYDHFSINVTTLERFSDSTRVTSAYLKRNQNIVPNIMQITAPANATSFLVLGLTPLTWYEISMTSVNEHGSSMAPYRIRVLTEKQTFGSRRKPPPRKDLTLPDVVQCCINKGVKHERCLQNLCNPTQKYISEPDLIVCAAWTKETFGCLTGGQDHSDCCRRRGLPDVCLDLCSGNVTKIDYTYFKCVDFFSDYRSCLLEGYGVLPSSPKDVTVGSIRPSFALLDWKAPSENADTVSFYHTYYRPLRPTRECMDGSFEKGSGTSYLGLQMTKSPQVLESLCSDTDYEIYVEAFNAHGASPPSERIIFHTPPPPRSTTIAPYNATECCSIANTSPGCMLLCRYDARMSHFRSLSISCKAEMPKVLRCLVGGRDHGSCCARRGVPVSCLSLCTGVVKGDNNTPLQCLPYLGNIVMCLEEGVGKLPASPTALHATAVGDGSVTLQWDPPEDATNITYQVYYQSVDKFSATHTIFKLNNTLNVSDPVAVLKGLKKASLYNMFVVSANEFGTSLPSSLVTVNATAEAWRGTPVAGVPSAPHSLVMEAKTATSFTVLWQPPIVASATDRIIYEMHYASLSASSRDEKPSYNNTKTSATAVKVTGLRPNTQYVLFVTATNDIGLSRPSETLLEWTDPAYPAFVETPTVHPTSLILEGGSMTVLCIAMGSPSPNVSLFISGRLIHQDVTRHMVTIIKNVTRDMTEISCYADNGYGTPMQSTVEVRVAHRPSVRADDVRAVEGTPVTLECLVEAWPEPDMVWYKDVNKQMPFIDGDNMTIETRNLTQGKYLMTLKMKHAYQSEVVCQATNDFGHFQRKVKVDMLPEVRQRLNVSSCCTYHNVSDACVNACDFDQVNFHVIMNKDECISQFGKLLFCGADLSDHRGCCSKKGVPDMCLEWCRSKPILLKHYYSKCVLEWAPSIFQCFNEGAASLPGPPKDVLFRSVNEHTAEISWSPPTKNADTVEMYRIFWRQKGTFFALKNDSSTTHAFIYNLTEGHSYEVAVKAGNRLGTSLLTKTRVFVHGGDDGTTATRVAAGSSNAGLVAGICLGLAAAVAAVGAAWYILRRNGLLAKSTYGISFENPFYVREQSGDTIQIAETPTESIGVATVSPSSNGSASTAEGVGPGFDPDVDSRGGYKRFKS